MRKQAERFGTELVADDVTAVDFSHRPFKRGDGRGPTHRAETVIVATGATRKLARPAERRTR